jgi:elongation factor P
MLQATQLRNGTIFEYHGEPHKVVSYKHTHMGRGSADVRIKTKGLVSQKVVSVNFSPEERFDEVFLTKKKMQYLYQDKINIYLMDQESFEQVEIDLKLGEDTAGYLKEGEPVTVLYWEDKPIGIEIPKSMVFTVTEAEPGAKGNSAVNIFKSVMIETGKEVKVPLFIKKGDKIKINTDTGTYSSRA